MSLFLYIDRIDAAKHMYPDDLEIILSRTKQVPNYGKPFVYQEVPDDGGKNERDYKVYSIL